jgi:hypothetical protein
VKGTLALPFVAVTLPTVGAPGTVAAVTLFDEEDADPVPSMLVAVTVNV